MSNNNQDQEIDLGQLMNSIKNVYQGVIDSFFNFIFFIKKKLIILVVLLILGIILGFITDRTSKQYVSEIIVAPNIDVDGTEYLYSQVDLLASKLKEKDQAFFKSIGIKDIGSFTEITIEPVIDIYKLVNKNAQFKGDNKNTLNFELVKLLAENEDINNVIKDEKTSKNYPSHKIIINTDEKISTKKIIQPLLNYLNSNAYLNSILKVTKTNIQIKMKKNEEQLVQLDELITQISKNIGKDKSNSNLVYNNENSELNDLFTLKNSLLGEIGYQKVQLLNMEVYIKDLSTTPNIFITKGINNKLKIIFPIVFIVLYFFGYLFYSNYKKHTSRIANK
jgi:hypothetical protein